MYEFLQQLLQQNNMGGMSGPMGMGGSNLPPGLLGMLQGGQGMQGAQGMQGGAPGGAPGGLMPAPIPGGTPPGMMAEGQLGAAMGPAAGPLGPMGHTLPTNLPQVPFGMAMMPPRR